MDRRRASALAASIAVLAASGAAGCGAQAVAHRLPEGHACELAKPSEVAGEFEVDRMESHAAQDGGCAYTTGNPAQLVTITRAAPPAAGPRFDLGGGAEGHREAADGPASCRVTAALAPRDPEQRFAVAVRGMPGATDRTACEAADAIAELVIRMIPR
jgi:hypothetical protein